MSAPSAALLTWAALAAGPPAGPQAPAWATLEGMTVGGPLDAVFALGLVCRPGSVREGRVDLPQLTALLFGNVFPHDHHDAAAAARALEGTTVCTGRIWNDAAVVYVLAMERRIGAVTVLFAVDSTRALPVDSVRRRVRALWGRGVGNVQLEEWSDGRFRAYLLNPPGERIHFLQRRLTLVDVRACTAFDRLLHRMGEPGNADAC